MKSQLDRNVRRFDVKLRDLVNSEQMPPDPTLPSLLQPEAGSIVTTNAPSAAAAINSAQSGGAPNVANAAIARLHATNQRTSSPLNVQNALLNQAHLNSPSARSQRETSADASKRRRLNTSLSGTVPTTASSLRQSSLGPSSGTPKAGTPNPASSRAGSAQPNKKAPHNKRIAPHQASSSHRKRIRSGNAALKKGDRKRHLTSPTPSSSRGSVSPTPSTLPLGTDGTVDSRSRLRGTRAASAASDNSAASAEPDAEGEEDDTQVYCVCQRVSFGDMVACDNDDCPHQWFHWGCVDLKAEPKGEWLCPHCRDLPRSRIVKTSDK
jgi:inhibitor of growth protein 3